MAAAKRISAWGIASLVLLLGVVAFGEYNFYLYDRNRTPSWLACGVAEQVLGVIDLAAVACAVVAMWRGSKWWALTIPPALLIALFYTLDL